MKCLRCGIDNRAGRRFCGACGAAIQSLCASCGFANEPDSALLWRLWPAPRRGPATVSALLHAEAPRRSDPDLARGDGGGAETGQRHVLRPGRFLAAGRPARAGGDARGHGPRLAAHGRGGPSLRGHGEPVPRRWADGALRRPHRAGGPRAPRRPRRPRHPRDRQRLWPGGRAGAGVSISGCGSGVNTGPVVVGRIGDDLRMDYTAIGDTTHLAARLQALAEPGNVLVSESTYRAVQGYVRTEALGPVAIKGRAEPVRVFNVTGRRAGRSRLEVRMERGLSPLAGRRRELSLLGECWERARSGQGQVVGVVGEAGVGKSRLLFEFRESLKGRAGHVARGPVLGLWPRHTVPAAPRDPPDQFPDRGGGPSPADRGKASPGCAGARGQSQRRPAVPPRAVSVAGRGPGPSPPRSADEAPADLRGDPRADRRGDPQPSVRSGAGGPALGGPDDGGLPGVLRPEHRRRALAPHHHPAPRPGACAGQASPGTRRWRSRCWGTRRSRP